MTAVGWIGLGAMGGRMARRLAAAGHHLTVWNRTLSRAEEFGAGTGARAVGTAIEAVRDADVVFLMLADPAAVVAVTEGPNGVATAIRDGAMVVDMSTIGPAAVSRLRSALPGPVPLMDVPVLGSLAEAEAGELTLLAGGPDDAAAHLWPLLSLLGQPVHVGPSGAGAAAKLVANLALLASIGVLGETLSIADAHGLPRDVTWRILARTPLAGQVDRRRAATESDAYPPRFPLALARKDTDLITAAADRCGVEAPLARAIQRWLADAETAGLGSLDYTAILRHIPSSPGTRT
ncbi:NAD(P)-dependent oxidoreductase [Plantactinospora sp. GCM10030261]|uniref:NAD(P)-dependent oxidoreductase n=1 Tax=Plantactinospora sp. GCM10030261 TaxID=3273420 RepID=UPI0036144D42